MENQALNFLITLNLLYFNGSVIRHSNLYACQWLKSLYLRLNFDEQFKKKKKYQKIEAGDRPFCREMDTMCRMQHLDPTQLSLVIFPTSICFWGTIAYGGIPLPLRIGIDHSS